MSFHVGCDGWVHGLRGQVVNFTGRVLVGETRVIQRECGRLVEARKGEWRDKPSSAVTLVVHGELAGQRVQDPARQYSEKLLFADRERRLGHHVHVVDAAGFSDLVAGRSARCRRLRARGGKVEVLPEMGDLVLGEPFQSQRMTLPIARLDRGLSRDLDALDRATAAHERTLNLLAAALRARGLDPRRPYRLGPQFDIGWHGGRRLYIAEVKSLTGADESQQIRLGVGQVLDYRTQLARGGVNATAVLAVERRPRFERWEHSALATGITLVFGPDFDTLTAKGR